MLYRFLRGVAAVYFTLFIHLSVRGKENIPTEGGAIICANHTHLFDPVAIAVCTKRTVNFMAKKDLFASKFTKWFFTKIHAIPVSRDGNDAYSLKKALGVVNSGEVLGIFPEGTREKDEKMQEFKPGVSMLALKTSTPIIPVYIYGNYHVFSKLNINIGEPVDLSDFIGKKLCVEEHKNIANSIIATKINSLKDDVL